jgi:hypothetical protein
MKQHFQFKQKNIIFKLNHHYSIYFNIIKFIMINKSLFVFFIVCITAAPDWTKVNDLFQQSIKDRIFPGAVLVVAN